MKLKSPGENRKRPGRAGLMALALLALMLMAQPAAAGYGVQGSTWFLDMERFQSGAHARMSCQECHPETFKGADGDTPVRHPDPTGPAHLTRDSRATYDYGRCTPCHRQAWQRYQKGEHAKALDGQKSKPPTAGQAPAPNCGFCHNPHYDRAMQGRLALGRQQTETCGSCHQAQATTYRDNFHGKAANNLGNSKAAFCTDCHGAHTVTSLKDPKAALAACKRCHPDAAPKFAQVVIHPTTADLKPDKDRALAKRISIITWVSCILGLLVLAMVAFFYGHSLLWLLRDLHHKLRRYGK